MLACRIHSKDDLRVESEEMPSAGPGEVLLKLGAGSENMRFLGSARVFPHMQGMFRDHFVLSARAEGSNACLLAHR